MFSDRRSNVWKLAFVAPILLSVAGCPWLDDPNKPAEKPIQTGKLVRFESAQQLLEYFRSQVNTQQRLRSANLGLFSGGFLPLAAAAPQEDAADLGTNETSGDGSATDDQSFTTTNLQEQGVDESDVFKSDGTYFYIARQDTLRIVKATPASELGEVGQLDLGMHVSDMYLKDTSLFVLAQQYQTYDPNTGGIEPTFAPDIAMWPPYYVGSDLTVLEVDVSDVTDPQIVRQIDLDGSLADSRMIGDRLILVLTIYPELPANPTPLNVAAMTLEDVMPKARLGESVNDMVTWDGMYRPEGPGGYLMTAVVTLGTDDIETILDSTAVMADAGTIYSSELALYITDSEWDPNNLTRESTAIHKFTYDENGVANYAASGSVPGRLLNQFSLGEYDGFLRAATHVDAIFFLFDDVVAVSNGVGVDVAVDETDAAPPTAQQRDEPTGPYNAVYVLSESGGSLVVVGSVEDIAPGEDLHSARFVGDHGFLVTYRQVDPLFVLDLTDPTNPTVLGELKVPGFSDYLHPWGEDRLIGVGKATTQTADGFDLFQGVQISLFDVSDWSNPTAVEQIQIGGRGSYSQVDFTHKAFAFLPEEGILAIPMDLYTETATPFEYGELEFSGVVAFQVDHDSGFTELGRLALQDVTPGTYWNYVEWARAAIIGNQLYGITPDLVATTPLDDFTTSTEIEFQELGE